MNNYQIVPLFDQILILPEPKQATTETKGGVLLPQSSDESPNIAEVIAVGEGKYDSAGNLIPMKIKVNDKILYKQWGTSSIKLDDKEYFLLKQDDVLALLKPKE